VCRTIRGRGLNTGAWETSVGFLVSWVFGWGLKREEKLKGRKGS